MLKKLTENLNKSQFNVNENKTKFFCWCTHNTGLCVVCDLQERNKVTQRTLKYQCIDAHMRWS